MTRRLVFRPQARTDIVEAMAWYETQGRGLGADFLRAVEVASAAVQHNPFQYQKVTVTGGELRYDGFHMVSFMFQRTTRS